MVSTVLSSWNIGDLGSFSSKCDTERSESGSTFDLTSKPIVISTGHLAFSNILPNSDESDDIFSKIDVGRGHNNKDDDSEEMFKSHLNKNVKIDLNKKNLVDEAFEKYDDPHAKFPSMSKTPKTPRYRFSPPNTPATASSWKYITLEERAARRKAMLEGHNDFCQALLRAGVDPSDYYSSVFTSSGKKESGKKFECSTPKNDTYSDCLTPLLDRSNINTPISGVRKLPCYSAGSNFSPYSVNLGVSPKCSDTSLNVTFSPVHDLPPEIKSTLLKGIVCYVDVRTEKENRSESVQAELLTLGAKVEKNFTKKVTHVVFKEGRVSTYLKAKKEGIPIVSVLWIEACKRVRGLADPAHHPPKRMEKYESILPFQTLKKRRLKFFNPNSKIRKNILQNYNDPSFIPTLNGGRKVNIKAATVCKDVHRKVKDTDKENNGGIKKYCLKKLTFDKQLNDENKGLGTDEAPRENIEHCLDDTSFDSMPDLKNAVLRRKSAPGKLFLKKDHKKSNLNTSDGVILLSDNDSDESEIEEEKNTVNVEEQLGESKEKEQNQIKKKRKLYDPEQVYVSLDENVSTQESAYSIPEQPIKRPRTKATTSRQLVKLAVARKRSAKNVIKMDADDDGNGSSPSTFILVRSPESSQRSKKMKQPSVVFTSVHRSDLPKYVEMVKELGRFIVDNEVTKRTTHVICNGPRRTMNLIKGIARGCWLVHIKWVEESLSNNKWLPEESYLLSDEYPCATECCRERRGLKTSKVINIFKEVGSIYVSKRATNPPRNDLIELLKICSATLSNCSKVADIVVGGSKPNPNSSGVWVSEKWIIDSITRNQILPFDCYLMSRNTNDRPEESQSSQD